MDESVSEGVKGISLGPGRGGLRKIKFSKIPQTGGSPGDFFVRQEDTSLSSPNSGKSPGEKVTRQGINNQQLASTPKGEHSTEDSLRFDRALEALSESTHPTKEKVFARKMSAYEQPNNVASKCSTHFDSAPPPVAPNQNGLGIWKLRCLATHMRPFSLQTLCPWWGMLTRLVLPEPY